MFALREPRNRWISFALFIYALLMVDIHDNNEYPQFLANTKSMVFYNPDREICTTFLLGYCCRLIGFYPDNIYTCLIFFVYTILSQLRSSPPESLQKVDNLNISKVLSLVSNWVCQKIGHINMVNESMRTMKKTAIKYRGFHSHGGTPSHHHPFLDGIFPCKPSIVWFSYGFPMVFLWFSYGFPMVFLWFSYGFPMVFLWFSLVNHHPAIRERDFPQKKNHPDSELGDSPMTSWSLNPHDELVNMNYMVD